MRDTPRQLSRNCKECGQVTKQGKLPSAASHPQCRAPSGNQRLTVCSEGSSSSSCLDTTASRLKVQVQTHLCKRPFLPFFLWAYLRSRELLRLEDSSGDLVHAHCSKQGQVEQVAYWNLQVVTRTHSANLWPRVLTQALPETRPPLTSIPEALFGLYKRKRTQKLECLNSSRGPANSLQW